MVWAAEVMQEAPCSRDEVVLMPATEDLATR